MRLYGQKNKLLFHYTTSATAFEHILPSRRLLLGRYSTMRDPMESKEWMLDFVSADGAPVADSLREDIADVLNMVKHRARLLSMTADAPGFRLRVEQPFGRGYARARMWEHYGDNHRGVCLAFDREPFVAKAYAIEDVDLALADDVAYTRAGISASPARVFTLPANGAGLSAEVSAGITSHFGKHRRAFFFLKTMDWATEHEFRVLAFRKDPESVFLPIGDSLVAVIVGEHFPDWQIPAARAMAAEAGAELLRLTWPGGVPTPVPVKG